MITFFTLSMRSAKGGDLLFTFKKRAEIPLIPEGTVITIADREFRAYCYFDMDQLAHQITLGRDIRWNENDAALFASHLREKGWECTWRKAASEEERRPTHSPGSPWTSRAICSRLRCL